MAAEEYHYCGTELEIFNKAVNWKAYFAAHLKPFIAGDVAEVGAGIGATTLALQNPKVRTWLCIEPDVRLATRISEKIIAGILPDFCTVITGFLQDRAAGELFDTVVYIDVIEHIEQDCAEIAGAFARLRLGGHLVVLVPAFQFLYSPFDQALGHFRRYSLQQLLAMTPAEARCVKAQYLDSAGFFLSACNGLFFHESAPTARQIAFWDRAIIPLSRSLDKILHRFVGRSAIGVWQRSHAQ
jgi:hypothetical protein